MSTPLSDALTHVITNWKTTAQAVLGVIVATGVYFAAVPTAVLQQNGITQKEIFYATILFGLAKVYLGILQKDA